MLPESVLRTVAAILLAACVAGCAAPQPAEAPVAETGDAAPVSTPEPVYRPIPTDALYDLLVAEFAARRGALDLALDNYMRQARATRDPGVAAQAARIARYLNAPEQTLEAAQLWAELDPGNREARFSAATELARAGRAAEAFDHMRSLHSLDGRANFTAIAAAALDSTEAVRLDMLKGLEALQPPPTGTDTEVARALLAQSLGDNDAALALTTRVLEVEPANQQALLIEAQVWQNKGDVTKAYARIERALAENPDNKLLRLHYARLLARTDLEKAAEQFGVLVAADPGNGELRLSLALVYREAGDYQPMREQLTALLGGGNQQSAAHFYLGEDAERREADTEAIAHYDEVRPSSSMYGAAMSRSGELHLEQGGPDGLARAMRLAQERAPEQGPRLLLLETELLSEAGELGRAWELLTAAIAKAPEDAGLLYARSMVSEKRRDVTALEADLREMLRLQPDSAAGLNALGYSLTNLTDRHAEALELIRRALELQPGDAAILDSMGWVQFRLGDNEAALGYLRQAFDRFPDHEVAAHLGEVLWAMGRTDEARAAWAKGLESSPDSPIIRAAMQRLGASPGVAKP